jgi:hypothetical protein
MGLAIATRQMAWFFVPFYLVLVARHFGWREAIRRSSLIALAFLALNGPFIVQSPGSYVSGVMGPMTDPMFPLGVGVIALFVSNVLPMLPKMAFTLAEVGAWAGSVVGYAWGRFLTPAGGIVLAAIPLFFAWRSLITYFYLVPLLALAVTMAERRASPLIPGRRRSRPCQSFGLADSGAAGRGRHRQEGVPLAGRQPPPPAWRTAPQAVKLLSRRVPQV